jgi:hypothetical protein
LDAVFRRHGHFIERKVSEMLSDPTGLFAGRRVRLVLCLGVMAGAGALVGAVAVSAAQSHTPGSLKVCVQSLGANGEI